MTDTSRRRLLGVGVAVVVVLAALVAARLRPARPSRPPVERAPRDARPNVVLISLDTLRPDHLGCYGYSRRTSDNLDAFAKGASRFTQARSQAPWTLPSHMSLMTSMLPSHNRVQNFASVLPEELPTLTQLLKREGYSTAGLVNDGQMKAHWGFDRGFDLWKEFPTLRPEGSCASITAEALAWLEGHRAEPFFLFLHYYDAHHPYGLFAPDSFRAAMGATLEPAEAERVIQDARTPDRPPPDPKLMAAVIDSYDAGIAWLDDEVGKVLRALPDDTLVVLFSDHGESFKEHGWTFHGDTLFEEETRVVLMIHPPGAGGRGPAVIDEPVMLMDVAPTILGFCGAAAPGHYEGIDLGGVLKGGRAPARMIPSETRTIQEARMLNALVLPPFKLIRNFVDGSTGLYRLPDETADLSRANPQAAAALRAAMNEWINEDNYWMLQARGEGVVEAEIAVPEGQFAEVLAPGKDEDHGDVIEGAPNNRVLRWRAVAPREGKRLYLALSPPDAELELEVRFGGVSRPERVFLGRKGESPGRMPVTLDLKDDADPPAIEAPFTPDRPGLYVRRHRSDRSRTGGAAVSKPLDPKTIEQLKTLGYL